MAHIYTNKNWVQDNIAKVDSYYDQVVLNYLNKVYIKDYESNKSSTGVNTYVELTDNNSRGMNLKSEDSYELDKIMSFVYTMLVSEDFGYGDTPELKYVVENIFRRSKSEAQMAFINMATRRVYTSDSDIIEKFFALLMSLEEHDIDNIALPIIQMFLSHKDVSAAEGALSLLDKYGKDRDALDVAKQIRDFEYDFLNDYKEKVIYNLKKYAEE
ncbi:TPA: hypothetical protein MC761_004687 [Enterobacter cloacae]|nr:hypothetical protein [Enterobacter cloacae]